MMQMSDNIPLYSSIFDRADSYLCWENLIRCVHLHTSISPALAERWAHGLEFLRCQLGDSFLRAMRHSHPFVNLITDFSPWHIARTVRYAEILLDLQSHDPGYPAFLKKLRSPVDTQKEMMNFLHMAELFQATGLLTRFPEPLPDQKNPDFRIVDPASGQVLLGELSRLDDSGPRALQRQSYNRLAHIIRGQLRNPLYSARQLGVPPAEYADELPPILDRLQDQAEAWHGHAEFEDNYIEIDLFPLDEFEAFNTWLLKNDRRKGFNGMPLSFNDTGRISDKKIKTEAEHFAPSEAGIIIFFATPFHFIHQDAAEATRAFKRRLARYPNIIGVFLYAEIIEGDAGIAADKGYTRKKIDGPLTQYSIFVENDITNAIDAGTRQKILSALR
jgi:hypothetical protein